MEKNFNRPVADVKGNFSDFASSKLETVAVKKGRKIEFVIAQDANGGRHNMGQGELSDLQDKNPSIPVLIKADKTIAAVGDNCSLNPDVSIGREEGLLILG